MPAASNRRQSTSLPTPVGSVRASVRARTAADTGLLRSRTINTNGIAMHCLEQGSGPLVLLCHGFPELSHSWRHQLPALAAAGYHAVAPDLRGYGKTSRPQNIDAYTNLELVKDMLGLLDAFGAQSCAIVGHDWGANLAWNACLMHPDRFKAIAALSVPFSRRAPSAPLSSLRSAFGERFFYVLYFQEPGVAESELNADVAKTLRACFHTLSASGEAQRQALAPVGKGGRFADTQIDPGRPPSWMTAQDFNTYLAEFRRNGFDAPLNWYRNIDRNWALLAPYAKRQIEVPALFLAGAKDPVTRLYKTAIDDFSHTVPRLAGQAILPHCGHWTQQEQPDQVNRLLLDFLEQAYA